MGGVTLRNAAINHLRSETEKVRRMRQAHSRVTCRKFRESFAPLVYSFLGSRCGPAVHCSVSQTNRVIRLTQDFPLDAHRVSSGKWKPTDQSFTAVCTRKKAGDRCNCFDRPTPAACSAQPLWKFSGVQRPTSQISICRSGRSPEEPTPEWRPHVPTSPRLYYAVCNGSSTLPPPRNHIPSCSSRNFGRQRFSD